ncbi:dTDP-glucose 4,6-dehydratase [Desulfoglaeba alkanexedens]|uniref:dTDP-glucose 4,6-dehydratase n=1 Tax=Desulfoglaeba alkanexedens ALDC TaxID=980445 RepID=A0A4P8L0H6_9BACT|nr:dTDP-glucose 4,6-dehydratase [Desulfoglaeba alkanexedens]QCQ21124.1 dTDP-glucose 4,6-dehydratase [Desulfoglaeba alkanexedens ALDC]
MKRTILVTGGCGFIGSNFVRAALERLAASRIINLDKLTYAGNLENVSDLNGHPRYRFVRGDICDAETVGRLFGDEGVDTVIHFAAESHVDRSIEGPEAFIRTNIFGTYVLLEAARKSWIEAARKRRPENPVFLHVSTDEVYGSLGPDGFFTENTPYDPRSPYSASKAASDHLVSAYHHTYGLPTVITNCSNNYGPYQFPEKLIPLMIINALEGRDLPVYGDGNNIRDWIHVQDHCEALLAVLAKGRPGETYNIGGNNERRNIEIVEAICDILDEKLGPLDAVRPRRSLIRFVKDRPGHDRRYAIDAGKVMRELGWAPRFSFEDGLRSTVDWYLQNRAWLQRIVDGTYRDDYDRMYGWRFEG